MSELHDVPLEGGPVEIVGMLGADRSIDGVTPRRLPDWTRTQFADPVMDMIVSMPAGVRLAFSTDATAIELDVLVTRFQLRPAPPLVIRFDLVIDGSTVATESTAEGTLISIDPDDPSATTFAAGSPTTIRFSGLAAGHKHVELWLPQTGIVQLRGLRTDGVVTPAPVDEASRTWLHYGSSISHCMEASSPTTTWPAVAARLGGVSLHGLGLSGQCMLDPFVARTIRDTPADLISMKVGINLVNGDTMRTRAFGPALHGFLDLIRDGHRDTPLLLVSPIFCPSAETHPGPTIVGPNLRFVTVPGLEAIRATCLTLVSIRATIASVVEHRRAAGDEHLHHLDGLDLFGAADAGDLPDDLHPNAAGYVRMGERFAAHAFGVGGPFAG